MTLFLQTIHTEVVPRASCLRAVKGDFSAHGDKRSAGDECMYIKEEVCCCFVNDLYNG